MIPKKIHYCWFGGNPLPEDAQKYLESWKKFCPDYEIIRWDEKSFDVNHLPYVQEAFKAKKWAFITDYVRLYALYNYGGIYMDTDVEVLKSLDSFLELKAFSGFENEENIPTGIMAAEKGLPIIKELMDYYNDIHFINEDGTLNLKTNVEIITEHFQKKGFVGNNQKQVIDDFTIFPKDYFCPKDYKTLKIEITSNTCTIHHFASSWISQKSKWKKIIKKILGSKLCGIIVKYILKK